MESDKDEVNKSVSKIKPREFLEKHELHTDESKGKKNDLTRSETEEEEYAEIENKFRNLKLLDSVRLSEELNTVSNTVVKYPFLEVERLEYYNKYNHMADISQESEFQQPDNNTMSANNFNEHLRKQSQEAEDVNIDKGEQKPTSKASVSVTEIGKSDSNQEVTDLQQDHKAQSQDMEEAVLPCMTELTVDVTDYFDAIYWDTKYASHLVNYVAIFYYNKYHIVPKWNPNNYDSFPENPKSKFSWDDVEYVETVLTSRRRYYEGMFYSLVDSRLQIDQFIFDAAVSVVLEQNLNQYYVITRSFELATAIAIFAIHSSQRGFLDALYHAVHSIVTNVKILRTSNRHPSNNLLTIFRRNMPSTYMYWPGRRLYFLPCIRNMQKKSKQKKW